MSVQKPVVVEREFVHVEDVGSDHSRRCDQSHRYHIRPPLRRLRLQSKFERSYTSGLLIEKNSITYSPILDKLESGIEDSQEIYDPEARATCDNTRIQKLIQIQALSPESLLL
jgi:hypothetical protein